MKPSDFFTRAKANEGERMPLSLPDGTPTDEWLLIRGVDSDEFRLAMDEFRRELLALAALKDEKDRADKTQAAQLKLNAALVSGWSFEAEFSDAALLEFLREAPYVAAEVDRFASDRRRFFGKRSAVSQNS
ncbi:phage tail assembly chaperone [Stutzerimonas stutzeri]|uniref:phage tail assembly chaperone n=1 Tax=Stutzerimonas stutzeri TaxID=316 RepID=UPI0005EBD8D9|nr:phage tail assembly chaperone [Stutzerimonas stutzeri]